MISCYTTWTNVYVHVLILINHYVQGVSLCYLYGHSLFVTIPPGISEKRVAKEFLPVLSGEGHYYKGRLIRCITKCLHCQKHV